LAMNLRKSSIHTLDLPVGKGPALDLLRSDLANLPIDSMRRVFEGRPEASRIVQHFGDSAEFDFSHFRKHFCMVYIDGAHSFDYVKNDTRKAFDIVRDDGCVVWDDYWRHVPDVPQFLDSAIRPNMFRLPCSRLVAWFSDSAFQRF